MSKAQQIYDAARCLWDAEADDFNKWDTLDAEERVGLLRKTRGTSPHRLTKSEIEDNLNHVLQSYCVCSPTPETRLREDLGLSQDDINMLVLEMEALLGLDIGPWHEKQFVTVADVAQVMHETQQPLYEPTEKKAETDS